MLLEYEFIGTGKGIPKSWDDFSEIRMMKDGILQMQLFRVRTINSFALVPNTPVIPPETGIPKDYIGSRSFMISRSENFTASGIAGRYAILLSTEKNVSKSVRTGSYFIQEKIAELILKRIEGFDPAAQPLAFENIAQLERGKKERHQRLMDDVRKQMERSSRWSRKGGSAGGLAAWIAGGGHCVCLAHLAGGEKISAERRQWRVMTNGMKVREPSAWTCPTITPTFLSTPVSGSTMTTALDSRCHHCRILPWLRKWLMEKKY